MGWTCITHCRHGLNFNEVTWSERYRLRDVNISVTSFEPPMTGFELVICIYWTSKFAATSDNISSWICTVNISLWHALIFLIYVFPTPLVTASNCGRSLFSGFPNCPRASATAVANYLSDSSHSRLIFNATQGSVSSNNLSNWTARKTPFLIVCITWSKQKSPFLCCIEPPLHGNGCRLQRPFGRWHESTLVHLAVSQSLYWAIMVSFVPRIVRKHMHSNYGSQLRKTDAEVKKKFNEMFPNLFRT
jgi:hypothetical protein